MPVIVTFNQSPCIYQTRLLEYRQLGEHLADKMKEENLFRPHNSTLFALSTVKTEDTSNDCAFLFWELKSVVF